MKSENIFLIQREGRPEFVKILDFGIAKVMGVDASGPRLTRTGMIFGTPEYMAPEQAEGKEADHRVDVYAVGCIAYHLMTGQTPFLAENFMAMLTKHLMEDPVPPSVRRPDLAITPEMDALVGKALEKDRDRRYQNMAEFLEAVSTCRGPDTQSGQLAAASYTREMGGAHAKAAIKVVKPEERTSDTEVVAPGWADAADSEFGERRVRTRPGNQKLILALVGVALGMAGALWFALSRGSAPAPSPTPAAAPTPVAAPTSASTAVVAPGLAPAPTPAAVPVPAPTPAAAPPAEPAPTAIIAPEPAKTGHASAGRKPKPGHSRSPATVKPAASAAGPPAPAPPKPTPSRPPAPPSDLKPFPGM
jgi:serine/threonine-protein kinase